MAHVQGVVHADVAAVVELAGVQVPSLDKPLGQHQGWSREFCIRKQETFALDHRITSVAHPGGVLHAA